MEKFHQQSTKIAFYPPPSSCNGAEFLLISLKKSVSPAFFRGKNKRGIKKLFGDPRYFEKKALKKMANGFP